MPTSKNIRTERLEKLEKIRALGWNPYPAHFEKKQLVGQTRQMEGKTVKTAGKLFSFRTHGNIAFADLKDETGKIQLFFQKKVLGEENYQHLNLLDIGDYLGVEGAVTKTIAGEISIVPTSYQLLSKALLPLPNQWYGLKDVEARYRQRYLDLLFNPEVRERFNVRTKIIRALRSYLDDLGFWEVETPVLQPLYGGANAKPFVTHLNALGQKMYLRIADELYLKRLIIGGYERVYEIAKDFRNEGVDRTHNPEFTMIEWYEAYADYSRVMDVTEGLFKHLAKTINGNTRMKIDDKEIDLSGQWPRIPMSEIMKDKLKLNVEKTTTKELADYCGQQNIEMVGGETKGQLIYLIFEHKIPETLIKPTWVIDYPVDVSPLSKDHRSKSGWVERFEGYIGGREICDGWSELTDPQIQRQRFTADLKAARKDQEEAQQVDEDFITAMEYGMPPTGGIGIGIDRLTMFFTNNWAIKEVILFPTLRREEKLDLTV
ncbi:lysine--tRNA ligase [Patescibacteria group bacterium]|nr:lysine--tRNA ligase [Patescibacteria group bacterium]MCL5091738.1 lysine--tRNA ligase [Patescibacteria group bacterium]